MKNSKQNTKKNSKCIKAKCVKTTLRLSQEYKIGLIFKNQLIKFTISTD